MKPALAVLLLLTGCSSYALRSGDLTVSTVTMDWQENPAKVCIERGIPQNYPVAACATVAGSVCTITAAPPVEWADHVRLSYIGHELLHCFGWEHTN